MKKTLLTLLGVICAATVFGQGTILFNNRVAGAYDARIYGTVPGNETLFIQGQPATGVPTGTTDYRGAVALQGTGYTAQLFGGPLGTTLNTDSSQFALAGTLNFRTGASAAGILAIPAPTITVPGVAESSRATLQIRVWDNVGGTITSWDQVLANPSVARGWSTPIDSLALGGTLSTPPNLGGTAGPPLNLTGLASFNLFVVPEPSVIALGVLGVGALLLFRRRKN